MTSENGKTTAEIRDFEARSELYLLGELSETEQEEFEAAYFADDVLFEQYLAVKDELLDAYARGELPPEKLARLAAHFQATSPRRRQVEETKDFIRAISNVSPAAVPEEEIIVNSRSPVIVSESRWATLKDFFKFPRFVRTGALAVLLILIGGIIWMAFRNQEPESASVEQSDSNVKTANQSNPQNAPINQQSGPTNQQPVTSPTPVNQNQNVASTPPPAHTNRNSTNVNSNPSNFDQPPVNTNSTPAPTPVKPPPTTQTPGPQIATILLSPVSARNIGPGNTLRLNEAIGSVRLTLVFRSDDYRNYHVAITTVGGGSVFSQKVSQAHGSGSNKSITLQIASSSFKPQDYIVTVKGLNGAQTDVLAEYYFRVSRNP